jgi:hypothetical protein
MKGHNTRTDVLDLKISGTKMLCAFRDVVRLYSWDVEGRWTASEKWMTEAKRKEDIKKLKPIYSAAKSNGKGKGRKR